MPAGHKKTEEPAQTEQVSHTSITLSGDIKVTYISIPVTIKSTMLNMESCSPLYVQIQVNTMKKKSA